MPELPEVETVRRGLSEVLPGRRAVKVEVLGRRTVRRQKPAELVAALEKRCFGEPERRGKYLYVPLDDGAVLVVHLRMSGQLAWLKSPKGVPFAKHTHVVVDLDDKSELRFVDPRTFGEWFVTESLDNNGLPLELAGIGPDPLRRGLGPVGLGVLLSRKRTSLKAALTDQAVIAGIGNIYADEICFASRLRPDRRTDGLSQRELRLLSAKMRSVLLAAVEKRGSSLKDASYRDLMGELGTYQGSHCVYGRAGERCPRCGGTVERLRIGARSAYCCTSCQR